VDRYLHRGPTGEPGEGVHLQGTERDSGRRAPEMEHLSVWELWRGTWRCKRRLWRWAPLSMGALLGNLGEGSCVEEGSGMGVSPYRGLIGGPWEGDPSTRNFERWMKGVLGMEHLSQKMLTAEGLEGRLLYWVPWVMKGRLWRQASLFMGAQLGNLEWAHLPETLRDG